MDLEGVVFGTSWRITFKLSGDSQTSCSSASPCRSSCWRAFTWASHRQPVPLLLDSESAALSEIHKELQHQLQPVIEPLIKSKYVDTYHVKTQRIITKWLNRAYPNHLTIRQSHTEKKTPQSNNRIASRNMERRTWKLGCGWTEINELRKDAECRRKTIRQGGNITFLYWSCDELDLGEHHNSP